MPKSFKSVDFQGPKRGQILSFSMVETLRAQFAPFRLLLAALDVSRGCDAGGGRPQSAFHLWSSQLTRERLGGAWMTICPNMNKSDQV